MSTSDFIELLWQKAGDLYRDMPWRTDTRPYYVLVSELMLQQTQVDRVIPKFNAFIAAFPDERTLAQASLADVLILWQGLGYNRRAKYLHDAATMIIDDFDGSFPSTKDALLRLPGVGPNTAGAIMSYAFNQPTVFIETNVRTVYFHHFFPDGDKVADTQLVPLIEQTIDCEHPRQFYWALMDYGSWLKRQGVGKITQSHHYTKQSKLEGSVRQVRGQIITQLTVSDIDMDALAAIYDGDSRLQSALDGLLRDGLVSQIGDRLHLTR